MFNFKLQSSFIDYKLIINVISYLTLIYYLKSSVNNLAKSMTEHNKGTQEVKCKGFQLKSTSNKFNRTSVWLCDQTSAVEQYLALLSTVTCQQWCRWRPQQRHLWCLQEPGSLRGNIPPASQSRPWPCPSPPATIQPETYFLERRRLPPTGGWPVASYLGYEIALADFFPLLLLPTSDSSRLHCRWQCRQLHLVVGGWVRTEGRKRWGNFRWFVEVTSYCQLTCHMT